LPVNAVVVVFTLIALPALIALAVITSGVALVAPEFKLSNVAVDVEALEVMPSKLPPPVPV
jgi:hypothetical protein